MELTLARLTESSRSTVGLGMSSALIVCVHLFWVAPVKAANRSATTGARTRCGTTSLGRGRRSARCRRCGVSVMGCGCVWPRCTPWFSANPRSRQFCATRRPWRRLANSRLRASSRHRRRPATTGAAVRHAGVRRDLRGAGAVSGGNVRLPAPGDRVGASAASGRPSRPRAPPSRVAAASPRSCRVRRSPQPAPRAAPLHLSGARRMTLAPVASALRRARRCREGHAVCLRCVPCVHRGRFIHACARSSQHRRLRQW